MLAKEKKFTAQRRQAGLEAAESARKRHQEQSQVVADRARKQVTGAQKRQADHEDFFSQAAGRFAKEAAEVRAATIHFLNTAADTGVNLARIAAESRNAAKKARNRLRAREEYDTLFRHLGTAALTSEEVEAIHQKMATLRELPQSLGERF